MGNAILEKLKELSLQHGEKAGLAIASMVFLMCLGMAASLKPLETSPEQIKSAAKASESNLNRHEDRDTIIGKLVDKGIKDTDFAKVVDEQVKTALIADEYKSSRQWFIPEPGAGLIRDTPKLVKLSELYAYPGRGGFLVFELDENGNRIADKEKKNAPTDASSRRRRRRRRTAMGGMGGGMAGMMGGARKKQRRKSAAEIAREEKEERERMQHQRQQQLVGEAGPDDTKDEATDKEFPDKESLKGFRWISLTGVLDHGQMLAYYRSALKNPAVAQPHYARVDMQRQTLQPDGTWSRWEMVDAKKNLDILENFCEQDEELTPDSVRPPALVDSLPFLLNGLWEKVHVASLVPPDQRDIPKTEPLAGGPGGMPGGGMGRMMGMTQGQYSQAMAASNANTDRNRASMMRMGGMMGGMGGMMGGMMGGGTETPGNYWTSPEKKVMVRAFDFTVEEDNAYRYRARVVVFNPNKGHDDTNAGVDRESLFLFGPWSDVTETVAMPPDVMPYTAGALPKSGKSDAKVSFQVVSFNPADGVTVPSGFEAAPGEVIGELRPREVPAWDGSGKKIKSINFSTRQIVLDAEGGNLQPLPSGLVGPALQRPVLALVLRPDGSVMVHNEADDESNEVRKDIEANYKHEIAQSSKKRESSRGMGMGGMMGNMMRSMMMGQGGRGR
jgi:hypothetical protein